jgi:hypothetical protein
MKRRLEQIDESIARYLSQLDTADRQGPTVPEAKTTRLKEKIAQLREEIGRLNALNARMMASEDKQISLSDPDARSMATSGKGSGMGGYNVQSAVDTTHHLIVAHEVTNVGTDRSQLSNIAEQARTEIGTETLDVVADRGYYAGKEILACEMVGITVTLPKPINSTAKAAGRFGKQDFVYVAADDVYRCPAGERLTYRFTTEEAGKMLRRYWTTVCETCALRLCARPARSAGYRGGSTRPFSRPCRTGSTATRTRCACAAKPWSIRSGPSRRGWAPRTSK